MSVCSNCGAELNVGAKFCEECGTPVPQTKACPKCGAQLKPEAKFCSECGYSFAAQSAPSAKAGVSVGDKNVIAGDVVGEAYKIHGNATIVKNEDETKKMVRCHVCGRNMPITEAITCVKCGEDTCVDCMDMHVKSCKTCVESAAREQDNVYRQAVIHALEDGVITLAERRELKALQKQLGLSDTHADEIEDQVRADGARKQIQTPALSSFEKVSFERAAELFYGKGETDEAFSMIEPIHKRHPDNEDVVSLYAGILLNKDPDAAHKYLNSLRVDILGVKIASIDLAFQDGDFADAEMLLDAAERLWPDSVRLQCRRIGFYLLMQMYSGDKSYLDRARSLAENIAEGETKLERSEVEAAIRNVMVVSGEDVNELTEEECEERGLYFHTVNDSMNVNEDDTGDGAEDDEEDDESADENHGDAEDWFEGMVQIPGQTFMFGRTPVTQAQWEKVMGNNPSKFKGADRPVENVSWNDCQDFIRKLNEQTGESFRLPTSEEWEFACRAGSTGKYGNVEDGQEGVLDEMGWYKVNSGDETHPVAQKRPNIWGLYDMHGNVWEWCENFAGAGIVGDPPGWYREIKGGSCRNPWVSCKAGFRSANDPNQGRDTLGFRLACSLRR